MIPFSFTEKENVFHLRGIPVSSLNCVKPYTLKTEAKKILQAILEKIVNITKCHKHNFTYTNLILSR